MVVEKKILKGKKVKMAVAIEPVEDEACEERKGDGKETADDVDREGLQGGSKTVGTGNEGVDYGKLDHAVAFGVIKARRDGGEVVEFGVEEIKTVLGVVTGDGGSIGLTPGMPITQGAIESIGPD